MKNISERFSAFLFAALLLACAVFAHAQVPVAIAPPLHPKFSDNSGNILASGFLYTYDAGTTTMRPTYLDSTGLIQNPDPIPLDATGAPTNGSVQTGIWLANQAYKFCAYNAALVQQWCTDNVTGYLGLLNTANAWSFQQTFSLPLVDLATDNQFVLGSPGNQTTLDFPPPTGNVVLRFPNTADTIPGRDTVDTLTNKSLSQPIINSVKMVNTPGAYFVLPNASPTGTGTNEPVKLINAPSQATVAGTSDTGGIIGLCVGGCGNTGSATIQQSGEAFCNFDGATTAGDYVQNSLTLANTCHDVGAAFPASGQVLGRVLSTNGGGGAFLIDLFGPEFANRGPLCALPTTATYNPPDTATYAIESCSFPANALNQVGKTFRITGVVTLTPTGSYTSIIGFGEGPASTLATSQTMEATSASGGIFSISFSATCTVDAAGALGSFKCAFVASPYNTAAATFTPGISFSFSANLTTALFVGPTCSFGTGNGGNLCSSRYLMIEQLN